MPDVYRRFGRRDQKQIVPLKLTPTASVAVVAQFHEIDWTFVFARPNPSDYLVLLRIDLYEGPWANDRIQCVVVGARATPTAPSTGLRGQMANLLLGLPFQKAQWSNEELGKKFGSHQNRSTAFGRRVHGGGKHSKQ
jgi:hypothetical protein